jgi:hypothetical protein
LAYDPTWRFLDSIDWRITLELLRTGTHIVQAYDVVCYPHWWKWVVDHAIQPHRDRKCRTSRQPATNRGRRGADPVRGSTTTSSL